MKKPQPPQPPPRTSAFGPGAKRYLVYGLPSSSPASPAGSKLRSYVGVIEGCVSLRDAAKQAAVLLFFRQDIRQVAALVGTEKGIFIATGKVPRQRHPKGTLEEVRFLIELERQAERKNA